MGVPVRASRIPDETFAQEFVLANAKHMEIRLPMRRRHFAKMVGGAVTASTLSGTEGGGGKIRIGQIGTQHAHADGQLEALRGCLDYEVVGIVEPDEISWQAAAKRRAYEGLRRMTLEELLGVPGIQVINVETEVSQLLDMAEVVVESGLHLGLDKPAGESLPRFRKVLETAKGKERLVKMGYMFRYNPAFELALRAIREGWLGPVTSIHAEMSKELTGQPRQSLLAYAGGAMFELGCHLIDSVVRFLGRPNQVTPFIRKGQDGLADNMTAVLEYDGTLVTLRRSLREITGNARRQLIVTGDHGTLEVMPLEPPQARLTLKQAAGGFRKGQQTVSLQPRPRYVADWADFARAIRGEKRWEFTPDHDLVVQETVLRASGLPVS